MPSCMHGNGCQFNVGANLLLLKLFFLFCRKLHVTVHALVFARGFSTKQYTMNTGFHDEPSPL